MTYQVCIEEMEGRWIAHVPALPGCFASDESRDAATSSVASAIAAYLDWAGVAGPAGDASVAIDEVVRCWVTEKSYEVNAFFAADRPPLTSEEIARALPLLDRSRADLLAAVEGLSEVELSEEIEGEWSIGGILHHVWRAEAWYLDRLGLAPPRESLPQDAMGRLEAVRARLRQTLPSLANDDTIVVKSHEIWSPRKLLRRALWHERDHTDHIHQFRSRLDG